MSIGEFIEWIQKLDDSYKIWLFGTVNAIFSFIYISTGQQVDPDSLKQLVFGAFIQSLGNNALDLVWTYIASPGLFVYGIIQTVLLLLLIWKKGPLSISIALTSFFGWITLFLASRYEVLVYLALIFIFGSYVVARHYSKLKFN